MYHQNLKPLVNLHKSVPLIWIKGLDINGIPLPEGVKYSLQRKLPELVSFSTSTCKSQDGPHCRPVGELQWKLMGM